MINACRNNNRSSRNASPVFAERSTYTCVRRQRERRSSRTTTYARVGPRSEGQGSYEFFRLGLALSAHFSRRAKGALELPPPVRTSVSGNLVPLVHTHERHASLRVQPGCRSRSAGDNGISACVGGCAAPAVFGWAGSCNTEARCPEQRSVSSTICPSGNSSASWCVQGLSMFTCRNRAT
jgi:hypothetical protein